MLDTANDSCTNSNLTLISNRFLVGWCVCFASFAICGWLFPQDNYGLLTGFVAVVRTYALSTAILVLNTEDNTGGTDYVPRTEHRLGR